MGKVGEIFLVMIWKNKILFLGHLKIKDLNIKRLGTSFVTF